MKSRFQFAFGPVLILLMGLVPSSAYALRNGEAAHTHSQSYHDRTPHVHSHGSHSHHG